MDVFVSLREPKVAFLLMGCNIMVRCVLSSAPRMRMMVKHCSITLNAWPKAFVPRQGKERRKKSGSFGWPTPAPLPSCGQTIPLIFVGFFLLRINPLIRKNN